MFFNYFFEKRDSLENKIECVLIGINIHFAKITKTEFCAVLLIVFSFSEENFKFLENGNNVTQFSSTKTSTKFRSFGI